MWAARSWVRARRAESVERPLLGIATHLRGAGQRPHVMKRGMLLYGPTGNGKNSSVGILLSRDRPHSRPLRLGPADDRTPRHCPDGCSRRGGHGDVDSSQGPCMLTASETDPLRAAQPMTGSPRTPRFLSSSRRTARRPARRARRPAGRIDLAVEIGLPDGIGAPAPHRAVTEGTGN